MPISLGDAPLAQALICRTEPSQPPGLLLATAISVVGNLGQPGPAAIPDVLAAATPADLAAEPTCLAFLGVQALRRHEAEQGCGLPAGGMRSPSDEHLNDAAARTGAADLRGAGLLFFCCTPRRRSSAREFHAAVLQQIARTPML